MGGGNALGVAIRFSCFFWFQTPCGMNGAQTRTNLANGRQTRLKTGSCMAKRQPARRLGGSLPWTMATRPQEHRLERSGTISEDLGHFRPHRAPSGRGQRVPTPNMIVRGPHPFLKGYKAPTGMFFFRSLGDICCLLAAATATACS